MTKDISRFRQELWRARARMGNIDWRDGAFTPEKAYVCAIFSKVAYLKIPEFEVRHASSAKIIPCLTYQRLMASDTTMDVAAFVRSAELGDPFFVVTDDMVVVGLVTRDVVIVSIRGTRPFYVTDWMVDLDARRLAVSPGDREVIFHRGFYLAITKALEPITTAIARQNPRGDIPVYLVGHSLGGAMAAIMYALGGKVFYKTYLYEVFGKPIVDTHSGYTFGMPRYGDGRAVTDLRSPFHVYNYEDIVPAVPPTALGFANPSNEYVARQGNPLQPSRRDGADTPGLWGRAHFLRGVRHHLIERYIRRIGSQFPAR